MNEHNEYESHDWATRRDGRVTREGLTEREAREWLAVDTGLAVEWGATDSDLERYDVVRMA